MTVTVGTAASWGNIAASVGALAAGMVIMGHGGSAGTDAIAAGPGVLTVAELLKVTIGVCLAVQAWALARIAGGKPGALTGYSGALLMIAAGVLGLWLIAGAQPVPATWVNGLARASMTMSGLWAGIIAVSGWRGRLPRWLCVSGLVLMAPCVLGLVFPPAAFAAFVLGIVWNIGLAQWFGRRHMP